MADKQEDASKEHEPTPKKLEDTRKKGDVARSTDLNVAAAYCGMLVAFVVAGSFGFDGFGSALAGLLGDAVSYAGDFLGGGADRAVGALILAVVVSIGPFFLVPAVFVLVSIVGQRSFVVAPTKIKPKLSRISPIENAKNKFGANGLFEFGKSTAKLTLYSILLGVFLYRNAERIIAALLLPPSMVGVALAQLSTEFLFIVLCIAGAIGVIDLLWQKAEYIRRNMMSLKELRDEAKESEGDPHLKQERRRRAQEIALNEMLSDVPDADVVIVNPEHYAVALKWDRFGGSAPVCVAKGVDHIAARIRELANESGVPIYRDPPTARAIHASVEIGQEIRTEDYRAVAVAIRFAEKIRKKATWPTKTN